VAIVTSYTTLLTAVADFLPRSDLTSFVPNFVQNWEERFLRQPENFGRWMETSADDTIASDVIAVPSGYLGLKYAYVIGAPSQRLDRVSLNQMYGTYPRGGEEGAPVWIAREGSNFVFGPEPDDTYDIHLVYWAKPTVMRSFASDAAAHWIIVNAPELALYGSLLESAQFLGADQRLANWGELYKFSLNDYRDMQRDEDVSGSPVLEVLA
jgi:hypothetical protein